MGLSGKLIGVPDGAPAPSTTGGPYSKAEVAYTTCQERNLKFISKLDNIDEKGDKLKVSVFVLDNVPFGYNIPNPQGTLTFNEEEILNKIDNNKNPFVSQFVSKDPKSGEPIGLEINVQDPDENFDNDNKNKNENHKSNHGLFIASIIKSIAHDASVTIMPILNSNGEGHTMTLSTKIDEIARWHKDNPEKQVIVNISSNAFYTSVSRHPIKGNWKKIFDDYAIKKYDDSIGRDYVLQMIRGISEDLLGNKLISFVGDREDRRIVVSAGNFWTKGKQPMPVFPAYLKNLISVGAIRSDGESGSPDYSNMAQMPESFYDELPEELQDIVSWNNGIYATGGKSGDKLLSLCVEDDITGILNRCKIAAWSGTSFAAAIVTGYLAWLCSSKGYTAKGAEDILRKTLPKTSGYEETALNNIPKLIVTQEEY